MLKKRVAIIGTNGIPAKYGGFETLADYLSKYLSVDYEISVYCSLTPKHKKLKEYNNSTLIYIPLKANGWQSMIYDAVSIFHAYLKSDVLIILGFSGVFAFPLNIFFKKKIVFNIGGIEWQKVRGAKFAGRLEVLVKKWFEKICVKYSNVIIVDNQVLFDYVKSEYTIDAILAEYGGDHAVSELKSNEFLQKYPSLRKNYDLTVSRAQEDMNIHILIDAYKTFPDRILVVISNWEISEYGKKLKRENHNKHDNIILLDAIYDLNVLNTIRGNCDIYLHTHSLCGTAPSLVEAMSLKLPVVCFDVPSNRATTEEKSYYFKNKESLKEILSNLDKNNITKLGDAMFEIATRRYTWNRIVSLYKNCIEN